MPAKRDTRVRLLRVQLPEQMYFRVKQLALLNKRPVSYYARKGIAYVLNHWHESTDWPSEYFKLPETDTKYGRGQPATWHPSVTTKTL